MGQRGHATPIADRRLEIEMVERMIDVVVRTKTVEHVFLDVPSGMAD